MPNIEVMVVSGRPVRSAILWAVMPGTDTLKGCRNGLSRGMGGRLPGACAMTGGGPMLCNSRTLGARVWHKRKKERYSGLPRDDAGVAVRLPAIE